MIGMYTWEGWQDRFRRTLKELHYQGPCDMESFHWDWDQDEDPQTVATAILTTPKRNGK